MRPARSSSGELTPLGLRVLLVDDSPEFLTSAMRLLGLLPKSAVHSAGSGKEAIAVLEHFSPNVIFLSGILLDMDGLKVVQRAKQCRSLPRIIILSSSDDPQYWNAARAVGTDRILSKERLFVELLHCISALMWESPTATATVPANPIS